MTAGRSAPTAAATVEAGVAVCEPREGRGDGAGVGFPCFWSGDPQPCTVPDPTAGFNGFGDRCRVLFPVDGPYECSRGHGERYGAAGPPRPGTAQNDG